MDALHEAQRFLNFEGSEHHELFVETALATLAYAAIAQAEAIERVAMHLGNIHQTLMTPGRDGEPLTLADVAATQAKNAYAQAHALERIAESLERGLPIHSRIADALSDGYFDGERQTVAELLARIANSAA